MNKREKLQKLYEELNALDKKETLPIDDIEGLSDSLIKEKISIMADEIKNDPAVKIIRKFGQEIVKFKQDFDVKPIISLIHELETEMTFNQKEIESNFEKRINDIYDIRKNELAENKQEMEKVRHSMQVFQRETSLSSLITSNETELKLSSFNKEIESLYQEIKNTISKREKITRYLEKDLSSIKSQMESIVTNGIENEKQVRDELKSDIKKITEEFNQRISRIGGGHANRKISINGTVISTRYTDINFKGNGVTYSAVDNNTTKQVDLTLTSSGGGGSGYQVPLSGVVDGVNKVFTWATAPNAIVVDNSGVMNIQNITPDLTVNWTGTTTTTLSVAPNFNVFSVA